MKLLLPKNVRLTAFVMAMMISTTLSHLDYVGNAHPFAASSAGVDDAENVASGSGSNAYSLRAGGNTNHKNFAVTGGVGDAVGDGARDGSNRIENHRGLSSNNDYGYTPTEGNNCGVDTGCTWYDVATHAVPTVITRTNQRRTDGSL